MSMTRRKQLEELRTHLLQLRKELELQKSRLGQLLPPALEQNLSEVYNSLERTNRELARLPPSEAITVVCTTTEREIPSFVQQITLDWCDYVAAQAPSPNFWKKQFWDELLTLRQNLQAYSYSNLALYVYAPMSVCVALGYIAESLTNYRIWIEVDGTWWQNDDSSSDESLLFLTVSQESKSEKACLSIELDLLPQTDQQSSLTSRVTQTINQLDLPIDTRFQLRLENNQALENIWQFQAIGSQLQALFSEIRQKYGESVIHLFIASSSSIAVSIGCKLVGFEPFQCYEFHPEYEHFMPACLINPAS